MAEITENRRPELGLSEEGEKAVRDYNITIQQLQEFVNDDIKDIFTNPFDRFKIRKFQRTESQSGHDESATSTESETELGSKENVDDEHMYTASDLLEKKQRRGLPSPAQKYFSHLIKDAAETVGIWKNAPPALLHFCRQEKMFLDSVLKEDRDSESELPESASNGETNLSSKLINHVIKWRKDRLAAANLNKRKQPDDDKPNAEKIKKKHVTVTNVGNSSNGKGTEIPGNSSGGKSTEIPRKGSSGGKSTEIPRKESSGGKSTEISGNSSGGKSTEIPKFKSFVLMEYSNEQLYWGILQTADMTNDFIIRNTCKPFYKDQKVSIDEFEMKISTRDYEVNPDMKYCVWKLACENQFIKLLPKGKFGTIVMKDDHMKDMFFKEFQKNFEKY